MNMAERLRKQPERTSAQTTRPLEPEVQKTFLPTFVWSIIHYLYYCVLMILLIVFMIGTMAFDIFVNYTFGYLVLMLNPARELYRKVCALLKWGMSLPGVLFHLSVECMKMTISLVAMAVHILLSMATDAVKLCTNNVYSLVPQKLITALSDIFSLHLYLASLLPEIPSLSTLCQAVVFPVQHYMTQFTVIQRLTSLYKTDLTFSILPLGTIPGWNLLIWICLIPARLLGLNIMTKTHPDNARSSLSESDDVPVVARNDSIDPTQTENKSAGAHGWSS